MKLALKLGASFLILLFVIILIYRGTLMWNPFAIQNKTEAFLEAVQERKYDRAAKLFGGPNDKKILAEQMLKLHEENGLRLLSYHNVKAEYDDLGFGTGHAELTFEINGKPIEVTAILTFSTEAKPKQVCA
ncbi:MAG: hypothetical protein ACE3L7_00715, partial [Candidatus Pristimantibacillus sp.]